MTDPTIAEVAADMLDEQEAELAVDPAPARPGYCNVHPASRLVDHRRAGQRMYYREDPSTVCLECPTGERERCTWCGGRLYPPEVRAWQTSQRRAFCSPLHRLHAFRARARAARTPKRRGRPPR